MFYAACKANIISVFLQEVTQFTEHILCPEIREISLDLKYPRTVAFYEVYKEGMFNYVLFISVLCLKK